MMKKLLLCLVAAAGLTLGTALPAVAFPGDNGLNPACMGLLTANERLVDIADGPTISSPIDGDGIPGEPVLDDLKEEFECL